MSSSSDVYTGPWINHSHGILLGATITLTTRDAAFLLAFLAIIVTTAGHSFWSIFSYIAHQTRSNSRTHDVIFYQEQAILKNSGSALDAAWKFSRRIFAWRKHAKSKESRALLFIATALFLAALFAVASIFSSQVTKAAGSEVLLNGENCGTWFFNLSTSPGFFEEDLKSQDETLAAANYVSSCYGANNDTSQCNTYMIPDIRWGTNENASCPFASESCLISSTAAYQMDTGPMDSHSVLGLNAKNSERVIARKMATCTPAHIAPYAVFYNVTLADGNTDTFAILYLGDPGTGVETNYTYEYDLHNSLIPLTGYDLQTITSRGQSSGLWSPIQPFNRTDADVSMFLFTANNVSYAYPNADPVFGANKVLSSVSINGNITTSRYGSDDVLSAMACIEQYQICDPNTLLPDGNYTHCTPLGPLYTLFNETIKLGLNLYQYATISAISQGMSWSSMYYSVAGRGASALNAQSTVYEVSNTQLAQLPDNQWQIELSTWFAVGLATLQQFLVERASGPTNVIELGGNIIKPSNKWEEAICERQLVHNAAGYQNFSTLGVAIILILGSILVILGLIIDTIGGLIQKQLNQMKYQRLSWVSDGYLQLQRMAHEGAGHDDWNSCVDLVPVSRSIGQPVPELANLDITEADHPCLNKYTVTESSLLVKK